MDVFEGWGGLYMLELVPTGIVGIMPGLADRLVHAWRLAVAGEAAQALAAFALVPWLAFGLSDMEFFNALSACSWPSACSTRQRNPTVTIDADSLAYADFLIGQLVSNVHGEKALALGLSQPHLHRGSMRYVMIAAWARQGEPPRDGVVEAVR